MLKKTLGILPFSIFALHISHYFPLTSKSTNNLFYIGIALPGLIFILLQNKQTAVSLLQKLSLPLVLLACVVTISAEELGDIKFILYLALFAIALSATKDGRSLVHQGMLFASLTNMAILSAISIHWIVLCFQANSSIRYSQILGFEINPVHLALLMSISLGYLWIFHLEKQLQRGVIAFAAGLFACVAVALLITLVFQARSALVGLCLFFAVYIYQRKKYLWITATLAMLTTLVIFSLGADDILANRGLSYRPLIWEDAFRRLMEDCGMLLGCGTDNYLFAGQFPHPHSGYVSVLYQSGILGFMAFSIFTVIFLARSFRNASRWLPLAMIGWGALVTTSNGMFTSPSHPLWIYFWLPTIMCLIDSGEASHSRPPSQKP